jgi:phage tail-like protein
VPNQQFPTIASAPVFVVSSNIQLPNGLKIHNLAFQELGGINSEISIEQYLSVGQNGLEHTKQFGMVKPPTITLKRGLDTSPALWVWHQMALNGNPAARAQYLTLEIFGGGLPSIQSGRPMMTYTLFQAWISKINISSAKAGEGFLTEDVMVACDKISLGDGDQGA